MCLKILVGRGVAYHCPTCYLVATLIICDSLVTITHVVVLLFCLLLSRLLLLLQGGFARVHELIDLTTNTVYAGKIIPKNRITKRHHMQKVRKYLLPRSSGGMFDAFDSSFINLLKPSGNFTYDQV
jgi:hypothetical protein